MGDLYIFNPAEHKWTYLYNAAVNAPSPRGRHGLVTAGGMLYVFGGVGYQGEEAAYFFPGSGVRKSRQSGNWACAGILI